MMKMMRNKAMVLVGMLVGVVALTGNARGDIFCSTAAGGNIIKWDADLTNGVVYTKGYPSFVDSAAISEALYFVDGSGTLYRTHLDGTGYVNSEDKWYKDGNGITTVAANGNGYVYAHSSSGVIIRWDSDLTDGVVYGSEPLLNIVDSAASSDALYFVNGSGVLYRTHLDGTAYVNTGGVWYKDNGIATIAVNGDGYIYAHTTGGEIIRWDEDLTDGVVFSSEPLTNIVDSAAGTDALYFVNGSGVLYRTHLDGTAYVNSGGVWYKDNGLVTAAFAPIPEPATIALLLMGGIATFVRRKK